MTQQQDVQVPGSNNGRKGAAPVDPMETLMAEIPAEQRRISAMVVKDPAVLKNEISGTVLSFMADGFKHLHDRMRQLYAALYDHADQLESLEQRIDPDETVLLPEDADSIAKVCQAFILLVTQLKAGNVPAVSDTAVSDMLDGYVTMAKEVIELTEKSRMEPEEDGDEDDEDEPDGDDEDGAA